MPLQYASQRGNLLSGMGNGGNGMQRPTAFAVSCFSLNARPPQPLFLVRVRDRFSLVRVRVRIGEPKPNLTLTRFLTRPTWTCFPSPLRARMSGSE